MGFTVVAITDTTNLFLTPLEHTGTPLDPPAPLQWALSGLPTDLNPYVVIVSSREVRRREKVERRLLWTIPYITYKCVISCDHSGSTKSSPFALFAFHPSYQIADEDKYQLKEANKQFKETRK